MSAATAPITTAVVATAEATAATATTATTTTAATTRTLLSDIDAQRPTFEILTIEVLDGLLGALGGRHLHEAETTRLTGHPVEHQGNLADLTAGRELLRDEIFGGVIRKVADVQTIGHLRTVLSGGYEIDKHQPAARKAKSRSPSTRRTPPM